MLGILTLTRKLPFFIFIAVLQCIIAVLVKVFDVADGISGSRVSDHLEPAVGQAGVVRTQDHGVWTILSRTSPFTMGKVNEEAEAQESQCCECHHRCGHFKTA